MPLDIRPQRPLVMGPKYAITADHPLAVRAGAAVLEAGGNAIDAAVAANLVMAVVRPHMCGLGGDLFALVYQADTGKVDALNASGRSPYNADPFLYRNRGLDTIPETDILGVTVPGAMDGWQALLDRYGTRSLRDLCPWAVEYAQNGFPMYPELWNAIYERGLLFSEEAARVLTPGNKIPEIGQRLRQPELAESIQMLADNGPDVFYNGPLGQAFVAFSNQQSGLFTMQDLIDHQHDVVEPIRTSYRGYNILTLPPNSQGMALLMQTNILENFGLTDMTYGSGELIDLMVSAKRLAFMDRDRYVCDPAFNPAPLDKLLSKEYGAELADQLKQNHPAAYTGPGHTRGGEDTVYLAVVDQYGNAVSLIQSLFEYFGSCLMVPGTGMLLHNRGRGFTLDRDHPNCLAPHKRPYHTLHCAMVLEDSKPYLVLGSPGADGQTQTVTQLVTSVIDFGLDPQQAVDAPRWRDNPDGSLMIEGRFGEETASYLKSRGMDIQMLPDWDGVMGSAQIIRADRESGVLAAGADPRRQAYALAG
jgi:gamma-glutamyltranspeptidase/glutathione hydrolase